MQFMVPYVHVSGIWPPTMVTPTVCPDVHPLLRDLVSGDISSYDIVSESVLR